MFSQENNAWISSVRTLRPVCQQNTYVATSVHTTTLHSMPGSHLGRWENRGRLPLFLGVRAESQVWLNASQSFLTQEKS